LPPRRILIAEDNTQLRHQLQELLDGAETGLTVDTTGDGREALDILSKAERKYSILLTDLKLPGLDGIQLVEEVQKRGLPVTAMVFTGYGSIQDAVQAMRLGAHDFLTKPIDPDHLRLVVRRALRERALQDEILYLREQMQQRYSFENIISKNPQMHSIFELVNNVAQTTTTVLLEGETGTGKELIARAIHQASARLRTGQFVPINCAAIPETLLESELFGHEKGAFTGAIGQRQGRFELADGGTLFLDEVGEIPPAIQVKLLRVLQERRFERVGGTKSLEVDVRLVAATNKSLRGMVKKGKFREDLYYRVNVVRIDVPPLREPFGGHPAAGDALCGEVRAAGRAAEADHAGGDGPAGEPPLAGERARAGERDGAGVRDLGARHDRAGEPAARPDLAEPAEAAAADRPGPQAARAVAGADGRCSSGRFPGSIVSRSEITHARSITFSSSRTFPGQRWFTSRSIAAGVIRFGGSPGRAYFAAKCVASSGMSSERSRSGGTSMRTTLTR